ncbi:hypothetical protein A3D77_02180 [Candidatus Gottesmanbacteria bacterium RIFCSPHIGHO2_02_FULL_39_11]|uniref:Rod shape-determining protein RodA n=1 Tax=Candidatus Gottesmanbacteria bacterium RIFCSPHIGHO2_02_FULL_39_11 TaxID=1798382 RepID=A0A1F5ZUT8_9BACT|nr:MAG: hypothetical protein A3D77_02180 [Candidatus Gottesmanbacteria bacterium RIFCSPHIGHO2_02_FULL_39_11]
MNIRSLIDPFLLIPIIGLSTISLFLIVSTTPTLFISQVISIVLGIIGFLIISSIDISLWPRFTRFLYILCLVFLLSSFLGSTIRGSHRWIEIFGTQFQPSEFIKPFMILIFSALFSRFKPTSVSGVLRNLAVFLPFFIIIFRQPDLGNAIVFLFFFLSLIIAAGLPWKWFFAVLLIFIVLAPSFWLVMHNYQRQRIITFLNPEHDPLGSGYNTIQAVISIGSGGLTGLGLGKGTQSRLLFLPEYHTDFVFASLVEELGFLGGFMTLLFYTMLLLRIVWIGFHSQVSYGWYFTLGLFSQLFIQIVINIGMNMGLLPITGITLPLISYGGSSIISTFIGLGFLISIKRYTTRDLLVIS